MAITRTTSKQDTRKPNFQPNHLPAELQLEVAYNGTTLGLLGIPQGEKLSGNGNVTFSGGIRKGWKLPDDPGTALAALAFSVQGVAMTRASAGVHASQEGNPTVCHTAVVELSDAEGEPLPYTVQVYATFSVKKGTFNLSARGFKTGGGVSGPAVIGTITGDFDIAE